DPSPISSRNALRFRSDDPLSFHSAAFLLTPSPRSPVLAELGSHPHPQVTSAILAFVAWSDSRGRPPSARRTIGSPRNGTALSPASTTRPPDLVPLLPPAPRPPPTCCLAVPPTGMAASSAPGPLRVPPAPASFMRVSLFQ
ncbi:unnamed protein product, partial [Musa acuminata subsp. malaccensis]